MPMADSSEIYDDAYYLNLPVDSDRISTLLRLLDFHRSDTVLEIGCAAGHFLAEIAPKIESGIGLDTAKAAIGAARQIKDQRELDNIEFEEMSVQDYASSGRYAAIFDYVLLLDVTEHIDDEVLAEVLRASKRLLKPNGQLVIHTPNLGYWLEQLKDWGIVTQLRGHIAVRNQKHYVDLIERAGFASPRVTGLPHYRHLLRIIDRLLMWVPLLGRLFRSRLFIVVPNSIQGGDDLVG